jgi:hypothetical protein
MLSYSVGTILHVSKACKFYPKQCIYFFLKYNINRTKGTESDLIKTLHVTLYSVNIFYMALLES